MSYLTTKMSQLCQIGWDFLWFGGYCSAKKFSTVLWKNHVENFATFLLTRFLTALMWQYKYYDFSHTDKVLSVCGKSFILRGFPIEFGIRLFFWLAETRRK